MTYRLRPLALASLLIAGVAQATFDWNLESTFLMHLQDKTEAAELATSVDDKKAATMHIYPSWVSEGTCSTKCVDIRSEEEFCVATAICEQAAWRKQFNKLASKQESMKNFEATQSSSFCEIWDDTDRCDGTLCDWDNECSSQCCGFFPSFTHHRCLPVLANYCPGRDTTRRKPTSENDIFELEDPKFLTLASQNVMTPCKETGSRELCDDQVCLFDGECRSGCCTQVLTKGYLRCTPMLVGDYCPRALDPIYAMLGSSPDDKKKTTATETKEPKALKASEPVVPKPVSKVVEPTTELPCNVFGTVDRCDGMACEHDGNCFSGCCSIFVDDGTAGGDGDQKRCMPLVNGDMCPIAIDVVSQPLPAAKPTAKPVALAKEPVVESDDDEDEYENEDEDEAEYMRDHRAMQKGEHLSEMEEDDHEGRYVYEGEFGGGDDDLELLQDDHFIPEKHEHEVYHDEHLPDWALQNILDEQEEEEIYEHETPRKSEHHLGGRHAMPSDEWRPQFHSQDDPEYDQHYHEQVFEPLVHDTLEEKVVDKLVPEAPESHQLAPKKPNKDDPRINIPSGKAAGTHDHVIVPKDPTPTEEDHEQYGLAYEADHKHHMKGNRTSAAHAPKLSEDNEPAKPVSVTRKSCSTYGGLNRCEGMTCDTDEHCASTCCGQMSSDGSMTCHALIEGTFCPRAIAPRIDYSVFEQDPYEDMPQRNDLLRSKPASRNNEMPTYRGQDGCKVHGTDDQCDGQPCGADGDCNSGCCGHFVSFSLMRCLPLTEDSLCPRFLEPSFTSPVPSSLPSVKSTIINMYEIQDRMNEVQFKLDPKGLSDSDDHCRSYGTDLCDGFVCQAGNDCESGCCGSISPLTQNFCQPLVQGYCPVSGIKYGFYGNQHPNMSPKKAAPVPAPTPEEAVQAQEEITPPQLQSQPSAGSTANPADDQQAVEQKSSGTFWNGVIVGVVVWVAIIAAITALYCCCKKSSAVQAESHQEGTQYNNLAGSAQQQQQQQTH